MLIKAFIACITVPKYNTSTAPLVGSFKILVLTQWPGNYQDSLPFRNFLCDPFGFCFQAFVILQFFDALGN